MARIKAFVGHSFAEEDRDIVNVIKRLLDSYKSSLEWIDAEYSMSGSVSTKVKNLIAGRDLFIGILSQKYVVECQRDPLSCFGLLLGRKANPVQRITSGWTLQESGFAIAQGQDLILLVENGVTDIGGLHADQEVIYFSRKNPNDCFPKIHEQLAGIIAKSHSTREDTDAVSSSDESQDKEDGSSVSPSRSFQDGKPDGRAYSLELYRAVVRENDMKKGAELFDEWLQEATTDVEKVNVRSWYATCRLMAGHSEAFADLEGISREFPDQPRPRVALGQEYVRLKQDEKGMDMFIEAAAREVSKPKKAKHLASASECLTRMKRSADAQAQLEQAFAELGDDIEARFLVVEAMAKVAEVNGDSDREVALLELAIQTRPIAHSARFRLAYQYHEMKRHNLALHHYLILEAERGGSGDLNNLGVLLSVLGLPGRSIAMYKRASEKGSTLADANIAHQYADAGFFDDARERLDKAASTPNYHENVNSARAKLDTIREEESKKEKDFAEAMRDEHEFRMDVAKHLVDKPGQDVAWDDSWYGTYANLTLKVVGGELRGEGKEDKPVSGLAAALSGREDGERIQTKRLKLIAKPYGRTAMGEFLTNEGEGLLGITSDETFQIHLVMKEDDTINAMFISKEGETTFEQYHRKK